MIEGGSSEGQKRSRLSRDESAQRTVRGEAGPASLSNGAAQQGGSRQPKRHSEESQKPKGLFVRTLVFHLVSDRVNWILSY